VNIEVDVVPTFENLIYDWDYTQYLVIGGYGSGKSYQVAFKIILKLLQERRRVLVVREVFDTIYESCFHLFIEILTGMDLLADSPTGQSARRKVVARKSPLSLTFPNGSQVIFKGLDRPEKIKSINDISIVWLEEATEIKYDSYKELLGRVRAKNVSLHFILSCNPVGKENWVYNHFFERLDEKGKSSIVLDENILYERQEVVKNGVYYHHSTSEDNPFLPEQYLKTLDELRDYDYPLYTVARLGRFGATGTRVLPQLEVAKQSIAKQVHACGYQNHYFGFDFGFEESFNAVISCAVDMEKKILYVYDEIYMNRVTDDVFSTLDEMIELKTALAGLKEQGYNKTIVADNEDPKAIQYYRQCGYPIRGCRNKFAGSRLSNTRKIKRFKRIIVAGHCVNTIRELKDLTYKKDGKGNVIHDSFNIDPHSFSAIWYALDTVHVADVKERIFHSTFSRKR